MIHTISNLKKGEEITFTYLAYTPFEKRQLTFQTLYNFTCNCPLCIEEKNDKLYNQRFNLCKNEEPILALMNKKITRSTTKRNFVCSEFRKYIQK
jgi:hypothetical protein